MNARRAYLGGFAALLLLVAVVCFTIDLVLVLTDSTQAKTETVLLYLGLATFAASFA